MWTSRVFIIWKVFLKSLDFIMQRLAWKINNGRQFHIGLDPWPRNNISHILPMETWDLLAQQNMLFISQVVDEATTILWQQGWLIDQQLNLREDMGNSWSQYINNLIATHILLSDMDDELIQDPNPSSAYTPKEGYIFLGDKLYFKDLKWSWPRLWKMNRPLKEKLFGWSILETMAQLGMFFKDTSLKDRGGATYAKIVWKISNIYFLNVFS